MDRKQENKNVDITKNTAKTVDSLLNTSKRHRSDPIFNDSKLAKKQEIKQAKKTSKKTIGSVISDTSRKIGLTGNEVKSDEIALLGDQMHFDAKEAYKLLRTNVLFCLPDNTVCRTIGITSAIRGEGKSTASINLAYTFAMTDAKVLLIDMDMRLPSVANKLGIESKLGLSDYLIGNAKLQDIIRTTDKYSNWDVMLSGSIPPAPSELIGSDAMVKLMDKLKKEYDFIIIDLPPVNIVSDALVAKEIIDGYVLVVRQDFSDKHSLGDCIRQLDFLNCNLLGFVMTDADSRGRYAKKYGKYYRRYGRYNKYNYYNNYGYSKHYGYGYYGSNKDNKQ